MHPEKPRVLAGAQDGEDDSRGHEGRDEEEMGQRDEDARDGRPPADAQGRQGPAQPALRALPEDARGGRERRRAEGSQGARDLPRAIITHQGILPRPR